MSLLVASSELAEIAGEAAHEAEKARHSRREARRQVYPRALGKSQDLALRVAD